ncbi:hypothetical protein [Legionella tunisiensis]|uniref:hypothetical protein n=1 Tax=Legionella tunisiensis TaxID=1034944 RepID=UPI0002FEDAE6|nr:hypothetical protein [Legionella tunisiensis]
MKTILFILLIAFNSTLIASDLGQKTYEMTCQTCHAPRFAAGMHAPAAFNKKHGHYDLIKPQLNRKITQPDIKQQWITCSIK